MKKSHVCDHADFVVLRFGGSTSLFLSAVPLPAEQLRERSWSAFRIRGRTSLDVVSSRSSAADVYTTSCATSEGPAGAR